MLLFPGALRAPRREPGAAHVLSDLFAVLLVAVVIVGAARGEPLIAALGALALVVTVVGRLWSRLSLEEVAYRRELSVDHVFEGDELHLVLTLENRKPLPVPWIKVRDFVPEGIDAPAADYSYRHAIGGAELVVTTSLARYERVRTRHQLVATKRGYYRFGPAKLESGDLFGLYQSRREEAHAGIALVVYPRAVDLQGFFLPSARPVGDARSNVRLWPDQNRPNGVREYVPGDPVKGIDWKATARLGQLQVRTYDPTVSQFVVIMLEAATTERPWDGYLPGVLEASVTAAASIAVRAADLGYQVGLVTNGVPPSEDARMVIRPTAGEGGLRAVLESLAMVRPMTVKSVEEMLEREAANAVPFGATVVYVAGTARPRMISALAEMKNRGHPSLLVWLGDGDPPRPGGVRVMDGRPLFGGSRPEEGAFRRPGSTPETPGLVEVAAGA
jgi:uncharacterized protein (DUF58 family)